MDLRTKRDKIKNFIIENIKRNKREYISLCIALFIGVVLGVLFINNAQDSEKTQIQEYINNFIETTKNNNIDKLGLFKGLVIKNILIGIFLWFIGSTVIGIPLVYAYVMYNGFCISYAISCSIAVLGQGKGIAFAIATILLQNIIIIPIILCISVSGIKLYQSIMKDRRKENIKLEVVKHTIVSVLNIVVLIIAAFVEAYVSTSIVELVIKYF